MTRGLFFMDGMKWKDTRRKMDPLFLSKNSFQRYSMVWSNKITDLLVEDWLHQVEKHSTCKGPDATYCRVEALEKSLHKWSVESILASLLGRSFFRIGIILNSFSV